MLNSHTLKSKELKKDLLEGLEDAIQSVMTQCELWTNNVIDVS